MNKELTHIETLVYYDGPQVLVAEDQLATRYLCILVNEGRESDTFLCIPVSRRRLSEFKMREVDLRTLVENREIDELFEAVTHEDRYNELSARPIEASNVPEAWLPEPGFFLPMLPKDDPTVVSEARERSRAVIHYSLNPPESRDEPRISVQHLGQAARLIQRLVRHAYSKAIRDIAEPLRQVISDAQYYQLEVFAFSGGSFTLHMQSVERGDLLGYVQISKALELIDEVTSLSDDPKRATNRVAEIGGHFATAYRDLVRFVSETSTPIEYEWSMPGRPISTYRSITTGQATPLYEQLKKRVDIGREHVVLVGCLSKVDEKYGTWRMRTLEDGKERAGSTDPDRKVDLAGLIIETQIYEFNCEERLEEDQGTGREYTRLYLTSYRRIGSP